jgi:hypothetical protein
VSENNIVSEFFFKHTAIDYRDHGNDDGPAEYQRISRRCVESRREAPNALKNIEAVSLNNVLC